MTSEAKRDYEIETDAKRGGWMFTIWHNTRSGPVVDVESHGYATWAQACYSVREDMRANGWTVKPPFTNE